MNLSEGGDKLIRRSREGRDKLNQGQQITRGRDKLNQNWQARGGYELN
jgi:hypothetical protein